jgi:multisubunit Na+/H+ antiporter MnhG subunit
MLFTVLWICWGILFVILESLAIFRFKDQPGKPHTLSAQVWCIVRGRGILHWIARIIVLAFMVWLTFHFVG